MRAEGEYDVLRQEINDTRRDLANTLQTLVGKTDVKARVRQAARTSGRRWMMVGVTALLAISGAVLVRRRMKKQ